MSRTRSLLILLGALALVAVVLYLGYRSQPAPSISSVPLPGLAWLPAEATLVGGLDLEALREQAWLLVLLGQASGEVQEEGDYQAFVEATGFDYQRDLDRVWLARLPAGKRAETAGVAQGGFQRERILGYVRAQAAAHAHGQFNIYEVPLRALDGDARARHFAFTFLDASHLAFGSGVRPVQQVIDCWLGKAPAVAADEVRARELEQAATGRQAWVVDSSDDWVKLIPGDDENRAGLAEVITQMAVGLTVKEQGLELAAEVRCQEISQAERLRDNLGLMIVLGQLALSRDTDETAHLIREALGNLTLTYRDRSVQARLLLSPATLERLLGDQPASPAGQP